MQLVTSFRACSDRALAGIWAAVIVGCLFPAFPAGAQDPEDTPLVYWFSREWPMGPVNGYDNWRSATIAAERLGRFPASVNTVAWLIRAQRIEDAFAVVQRIIDTRPEAIGEVFEANDWGEVRRDQTKGYRERLRELVDLARAKVRSLDRESQARAALAMINVEMLVAAVQTPNDYEQRLGNIITGFPGTTAAGLAEVDLVGMPRLTPEALKAYDSIAANHPGTEVAARALYRKAFHLAKNAHAVEPAGQAEDSTARFLEVLRITAELERGNFDMSALGGEAPDLVLQFRSSDGKPSPENRARLLEAYLAYARDHLALIDHPRHGLSLEQWIGYTVPLFAASVGDAGAADRWFDEVERLAPDQTIITFLRAQWLARSDQLKGVPPARSTDAADARRLRSRVAAGQGVLARRALVTLATQSLVSADLPSARTLFAEYQKRFADAPEAWMAGLRVAQVDHVLGRFDEAARGFSETSSRYASVPFARVLGAAYASRSLEAAGRFDQARLRYAEALSAWTPPVHEWLSAGWPPDLAVMGPFTIRRPDFTRRLAQLARVLPMPDGQQLAHAQWLLMGGHPSEARLALEPLIARSPRSASAMEARLILHRAQLDEAVALASGAAPSPNVAHALRSLEALTREPFDSAIALAGVVRATILMLDGQRAAADAAMTTALQSWGIQGGTAPVPAQGSLAQDVLAVRDAIFQPLGGPQLKSPNSGWNAFEWPSTLPRFVVVSRVLRAKEFGHQLPADVDVSRQPTGLTNALFVDVDDLEYLTALVPKLGGTKRREPTSIMEVPNQPIGGAMAVLRWWDRYFPTRPGHWGGVEILTYPAFTSIEFTDAARTRALVPINVGYSGATVVLEKTNGRWTIKELVNHWIT
jgi:tetratricopeptide (TPR) repeat protein